MSNFDPIFVISSHNKFFKKTTSILIKSLLKCGIKKNRILVVVGDCPENKKIKMNGIDYIFVNHNSYDHTGLIYIVESNQTHPWWWVMHDTCEVGGNFYKKILERGCTHKHISLGEEGWLNMGLFSLDFILESQNYILSLKNCSKLRAILSERVYPILTESSAYSKKDSFQLLDHKIVYGDGVLRRVIYYPEIDLYKYQSFYLEKKSTLNFLKQEEFGIKFKNKASR